MTVISDRVRSDIFAGDGVSRTFPTQMYFLENDDLQVFVRNPSGQTLTLALGTDYTVSGALNQSGGSITTSVPLPPGWLLVILRNVEPTQETDYVPGDPFPADTHEMALDKLTMLIQQILEQLSRAWLADPFGGTFPNLNDFVRRSELSAYVRFSDLPDFNQFVTLDGVQTVTNKTLVDPSLVFRGTRGVDGDILLSRGPDAPAEWVNPTAAGIGGGDSWETGDLRVTARNLTLPDWIPADGSIQLQAQYPDLFNVVGLIPEFVGWQADLLSIQGFEATSLAQDTPTGFSPANIVAVERAFFPAAPGKKTSFISSLNGIDFSEFFSIPYENLNDLVLGVSVSNRILSFFNGTLYCGLRTANSGDSGYLLISSPNSLSGFQIINAATAVTTGKSGGYFAITNDFYFYSANNTLSRIRRTNLLDVEIISVGAPYFIFSDDCNPGFLFRYQGLTNSGKDVSSRTLEWSNNDGTSWNPVANRGDTVSSGGVYAGSRKGVGINRFSYCIDPDVRDPSTGQRVGAKIWLLVGNSFLLNPIEITYADFGYSNLSLAAGIARISSGWVIYGGLNIASGPDAGKPSFLFSLDLNSWQRIVVDSTTTGSGNVFLSFRTSIGDSFYTVNSSGQRFSARPGSSYDPNTQFKLPTAVPPGVGLRSFLKT